MKNKHCKKYQISDNLFSLAAKISDVEIMIILTSKITYTDKSGTYKKTPLHVAVENNNYDIADILIKNGADIYKQDLFSISPYDIAKSKGKNKLLLSFIASSKISKPDVIELYNQVNHKSKSV